MWGRSQQAIEKQEEIAAFEVCVCVWGGGSGGWGGVRVAITHRREEVEEQQEDSHLVPEPVLGHHVHQQDVLGAGQQPRQADLAVGEHAAARLGDDHLGADVVEGLPQLRVLHAHPDAALQVGVRAWRHGRGGGRGGGRGSGGGGGGSQPGRRAAEGGL